MYTFTKTRTVQSARLPGVEIVFKKMTEDRRSELQRAVAEPQAKVRQLLAQMARLRKEGDEAEPQLLDLNDKLNEVVTKELNPARVRWAVSAVKGLCLDDENDPATIDNYGRWPSDLVEEILELVEEGTVLGERETKNSSSPTTSGAEDGGATSDTTATGA